MRQWINRQYTIFHLQNGTVVKRKIVGELVYDDWSDIQGTLTSVEFGSLVTSIGDQAFSNYTSLQSITIPSSVTSIGQYAFSYLPNNTQFTFIDKERSNVESLLTENNVLGDNDDGITFTMTCSDGTMTASFEKSTNVWTFTYN